MPVLQLQFDSCHKALYSAIVPNYFLSIAKGKVVTLAIYTLAMIIITIAYLLDVAFLWLVHFILLFCPHYK